MKNISSIDVFPLSQSGECVLVDIRTPQEWHDSGTPEKALLLSMEDEQFFPKLASHLKNKKDTPIAVICAAGGRSKHIAGLLEEAGYTTVYNVADGVLGSSFGKGWLDWQLPMDEYHLSS